MKLHRKQGEWKQTEGQGMKEKDPRWFVVPEIAVWHISACPCLSAIEKNTVIVHNACQKGMGAQSGIDSKQKNPEQQNLKALFCHQSVLKRCLIYSYAEWWIFPDGHLARN